MECSEPGAIYDEELVAYLAGETVRPSVVEHIKQCQRCASQVARYNRMELQLMSKLYRWDCPSNQVLGEYQIGLLAQDQVAAVKNHLNMCVLCAAEVVALEKFLAHDPMLIETTSLTADAISVPAASANNHRSVQGKKRVLDQVREQSLAGARRIIATLLPPQPRLAYQRSTSAAPAQWPRRYEAEDVSISIQLEQEANYKHNLQLVGFVTRKGTSLAALEGSIVQLSASGTIYTQTIDELGNFVFPKLAPATYGLELQLPEAIVVIDQLPLMEQE